MLRANSPRITFCTGYWLVGGNVKRTPGYYKRYIPQTLKMIAGCRLIVFYGDEAILDFFKDHARAHRIELYGLKVPVHQLPAYPHRAQLLQGCELMKDTEFVRYPRKFKKEKGVKHYFRDFLGSGAESYGDIISVWMSKIPLIAEHAIPANPFGSDHFAWIDASVARFRHSRSNWNFMRLSFEQDALYHYDNDTHCMGNPIAINASFLLAHRDIWPQVGDLFQKQMMVSLKDHYAHDEETILNLVLQSNGHLFRLAGRNHRGYRKRLFKLWHRFARLATAQQA